MTDMAKFAVQLKQEINEMTTEQAVKFTAAAVALLLASDSVRYDAIMGILKICKNGDLSDSRHNPDKLN